MADHDLIFVKNWSNNNDLTFGVEGGVEGLYTYARVKVQMPAPNATVKLRNGPQATIKVTMPKPVARVVADFDNAVSRGLRVSTEVPWQDGADMKVETKLVHQDAKRHIKSNEMPWSLGTQRRSGKDIRWQDNQSRRVQLAANWQDGTQRGYSANTKFQDMDRRVRPQLKAKWEEGTQRGNSVLVGFKDMLRTSRPRVTMPWGQATPMGTVFTIPSRKGLRMNTAWRARWGVGRPTQPGVRVDIPPEVELCYTPPHGHAVNLTFLPPWVNNNDLTFRCYTFTGVDPSPGGEQVIVPIKRVYMTVNNVFVKRLDTNEHIPIPSLSMSLDYTTWTWGFNASVARKHLALLERTDPDVPVILQASINDVPYNMILDSKDTRRTFQTGRANFRGRGLSSVLDAPNAGEYTWDNVAGSRTMNQLFEDMLTINAVNIGWEVESLIDDWLVPAGRFTYSGTHAGGLNRLAEAAGAFVQPHPTLQKLFILKKYPIRPWDWAGVTADYVIPSAVAVTEDIKWISKPKYNGVTVRGENIGIQGFVNIDGTDGSFQAPMVVDPLITEAIGAGQRAMPILADTGNQTIITLSMPVLEETGIILPNKFVQYNDGSVSRIGIVRGVAVNYSDKLRQTLEIQSYA